MATGLRSWASRSRFCVALPPRCSGPNWRQTELATRRQESVSCPQTDCALPLRLCQPAATRAMSLNCWTHSVNSTSPPDPRDTKTRSGKHTAGNPRLSDSLATNWAVHLCRCARKFRTRRMSSTGEGVSPTPALMLEWLATASLFAASIQTTWSAQSGSHQRRFSLNNTLNLGRTSALRLMDGAIGSAVPDSVRGLSEADLITSSRQYRAHTSWSLIAQYSRQGRAGRRQPIFPPASKASTRFSVSL